MQKYREFQRYLFYYIGPVIVIYGLVVIHGIYSNCSICHSGIGIAQTPIILCNEESLHCLSYSLFILPGKLRKLEEEMENMEAFIPKMWAKIGGYKQANFLKWPIPKKLSSENNILAWFILRVMMSHHLNALLIFCERLNSKNKIMLCRFRIFFKYLNYFEMFTIRLIYM